MSDWLSVHGLADNELSAEERIAIEKRLQECEMTRAEYDSIHALKKTLREKCNVSVPEGSWQKCCKRLDELDKARRVESFVGRYAWGLCGCFLAAILIGASISRASGPKVHSTEVMRASAGWPAMVAPDSNNLTEQQRWVRGIFDGAEPVHAGKFVLHQASRGMVNGLDVRRLDFSDQYGLMRLFVMEGEHGLVDSDNTEGYLPVQVQEVGGITWHAQGRTFLLIGDRTPEKLSLVADALRR